MFPLCVSVKALFHKSRLSVNPDATYYVQFATSRFRSDRRCSSAAIKSSHIEAP